MMLRGTQIKYMPDKSHVIIIIINTQGQIVQIHLRDPSFFMGWGGGGGWWDLMGSTCKM